jgi:ornithine cyclodeaminase/alanine dehydrogenase-like protein (mu-crystallin family)
MTGSILRLGVEELWRALEDVDPVALITAALRDTTGSSRTAGLSAWRCDRPDEDAAHEELVLFEDPVTDHRCLLPAKELQAVRKGALVVMAAQELLDSCTVTVGVLGSGRDAQGQLLVMANCLRNISHLAMSAPDEWTGPPFEQWMLDRLDLSGIGLDVCHDAADAVFGADLVLIAGPRIHGLEFAQLARGNVLVNTSGRRLPAGVVHGVDHVYVDDVRLLGGHPQLTADDRSAGSAARQRGRTGHARRHVDADLRQMLSGRHPGRVRSAEIALVEILDSGPASPLDVTLAASVSHWAALGRDL